MATMIFDARLVEMTATGVLRLAALCRPMAHTHSIPAVEKRRIMEAQTVADTNCEGCGQGYSRHRRG